MNAFTTTAADLANALMGRSAQTVHVCKASFHRNNSRYVVLVDGETYEVGKRALQALKDGWTPAELELTPHVEDDDEDGDGFADYSHSNDFATLYRRTRT